MLFTSSKTNAIKAYPASCCKQRWNPRGSGGEAVAFTSHPIHDAGGGGRGGGAARWRTRPASNSARIQRGGKNRCNGRRACGSCLVMRTIAIGYGGPTIGWTTTLPRGPADPSNGGAVVVAGVSQFLTETPRLHSLALRLIINKSIFRKTTQNLLIIHKISLSFLSKYSI